MTSHARRAFSHGIRPQTRPESAAAHLGQIKELQSYDWPGNVRELQNVVDPPPSSPARKTNLNTQPPLVSLSELKARERSLTLEALAKTGDKIYRPDGAAALL